MNNVVEEGDFKKHCKKPSTDAPWFDETCKKSKAEIRNTAKSLQNQPSNLDLRNTLNEKKRRNFVE